MREGRDCSIYLGCTEAIGEVSASGGGGSLRSSGGLGVFFLKGVVRVFIGVGE